MFRLHKMRRWLFRSRISFKFLGNFFRLLIFFLSKIFFGLKNFDKMFFWERKLFCIINYFSNFFIVKKFLGLFSVFVVFFGSIFLILEFLKNFRLFELGTSSFKIQRSDLEFFESVDQIFIFLLMP